MIYTKQIVKQKILYKKERKKTDLKTWLFFKKELKTFLWLKTWLFRIRPSIMALLGKDLKTWRFKTSTLKHGSFGKGTQNMAFFETDLKTWRFEKSTFNHGSYGKETENMAL